MFTVVICSSEFLNSLKTRYSHIYDAVTKDSNCAFCEWDYNADTYEQALPDLDDMIARHQKWRAVVVQDKITFGMDSIDKRNPFDAVGVAGTLDKFEENILFNSVDEIFAKELAGDEIPEEELVKLNKQIEVCVASATEYATKKISNYRAAVNNPITKLGLWFYGIPFIEKPRFFDSLPESYRDFKTPIDNEYLHLLLKEGILLSEIMQYHILCSKYETLKFNGYDDAKLNKKPESIVVLSERRKNHENDIFFSDGLGREELEYSSFCDDNIYSGNMIFMFSDVAYNNNKPHPKDYIEFLTSVIAFSHHETPDEVVRTERVYKITTTVNVDSVCRLYSRYLTKLTATRKYINGLRRKKYDDITVLDVSPDEAIEVFESDVKVPVVIDSRFDKADLKAREIKIGLSKDCPDDEPAVWAHKVKEITKNFIRYLREPRRALHKSVKHDFRSQNRNDNERAFKLDEYQREDVYFRLIEEEQRMVETSTANIFESEKYLKRLDEADRAVKREISERMTRKRVVISSVIAISVFLFAFLPLIISNVNTVKSFMFSGIFFGVSLALFLVCGLVYLFVKRSSLLKKIAEFNSRMDYSLNEIDDGMNRFSDYLSHACNVMREFSVLENAKSMDSAKLNVYKRHIHEVERKIDETTEMFVDNFCFVPIDEEIAPFYYDYEVDCAYNYEIPYEECVTRIPFISKEYFVMMPVDYIDSISLDREDLYD